MSKNKGNKLDEAQKQEEFNQGVQTMGEWVKELETTIITQEKATDLTTATRLYQKHKVILTYILKCQARLKSCE